MVGGRVISILVNFISLKLERIVSTMRWVLFMLNGSVRTGPPYDAPGCEERVISLYPHRTETF
ncbi:hypothetical protein ES703_13073 [subsurface metagenome]